MKRRGKQDAVGKPSVCLVFSSQFRRVSVSCALIRADKMSFKFYATIERFCCAGWSKTDGKRMRRVVSGGQMDLNIDTVVTAMGSIFFTLYLNRFCLTFSNGLHFLNYILSYIFKGKIASAQRSLDIT